MRLPSPDEEPTISIVRAGELLGLSPDGSWRAARDGFIRPLIRTSARTKRVLTRPFLEQLGALGNDLAQTRSDPSS